MGRFILQILHFLSRRTGTDFIFLILVGLLLLGVVDSLWVWGAVVLFLVSLTAEALLRSMEKFSPGSDLETEHGDELWTPLAVELQRREAEQKDARWKVIAWWLALPCLLFGVWAWFEPVVGWYHSLRLPAAVIVGGGVLLLMLPDKAFRHQARKRTALRSSVAALIITASLVGLAVRHPYLIPGFRDANRVRAERLLSPPNIVAIQHHSYALVRYGLELESSGEIQKAGDLLQLAARVDGTNPDAQEAFADFLKRRAPSGQDEIYRKLAADLRSGVALAVSSRGYQLDASEPLPVLGNESTAKHAIVLVADKETPSELLDILGSVLGKELGVAVYRHPQMVDIRGVTRQSGMTSRQVGINEAWQEAAGQLPARKPGCHQYLVVTKRDLFAPGTNFLYSSATVPGSAIVSYHRFGNADRPCEDRGLLDSLCKQALSATIKSLTIYPSPDPRDVTAYVNGAFQLSRKGRRPLPATLVAYREQIARWEAAARLLGR